MRIVTRKRILIGLGGIAFVFLLLFHYKERDSYRCQSCSSVKNVFQWRLGTWIGGSIPLTPAWEQIDESHLRRDFFPINHVHDWKFAQGSPYHFFGTKWGGCALGAGRQMSSFCQTYESNLRFRTFILEKLKDGSLARSNVIAMVSEPRSEEQTPLQKESDALLDAFYSR
jgi:hypothetical protein